MTHATEIDAIKDTIKLIELLVTSLHGDKTFLSLGNEMIGADCVCVERVSPSQLYTYIGKQKISLSPFTFAFGKRK